MSVRSSKDSCVFTRAICVGQKIIKDEKIKGGEKRKKKKEEEDRYKKRGGDRCEDEIIIINFFHCRRCFVCLSSHIIYILKIDEGVLRGTGSVASI